MCGAEAEEGGARAAVLPVVVGVGQAEAARVDGAVVVAVSGQRALPVVVEVGAIVVSNVLGGLVVEEGGWHWAHIQVDILRDGDKVGTVRAVDETVVKVLVGAELRVEFAVVDPDVGALLFFVFGKPSMHASQ